MAPNSFMILCFLGIFAGCEGEGVRAVWISEVSPSVVAPGDVVHVRGSGLTGAQIPAFRKTDTGGNVLLGLDAVLVAGEPAEVLRLADDRIELRVPAAAAPGAAWVVVWAGGTASNAVPIHILGTP